MESSNTPKKVLTRGYIDGCFDIMHSGHYNAIRQAKSLCDVLVVGVHSDEEIFRNKGPPVMKQAERYKLLESIKWIDEIVYDVPYSPSLETLNRARADFCVHGDDMPVNADGIGAYDEMKKEGRLKIIKRTEGVSTTDLVGRLLLLTKDHWSRQEKSPTRASQVVQECESPIPSDPDDSEEQVQRQIRAAQKSQILMTTRRIAEFSSRKVPAADDVIVYVQGSFDMFHVGHAAFLEKAKQLGTYLLVGVHDDETVNHAVGANFPVMNMHERVLNVCACKHVDEVIMGAPDEITNDLITTMNISIVAHTSLDYDGNSESTIEVARTRGILKEVSVPEWEHINTATIVERIVSNRLAYLRRNDKRAQMEDTYYRTKKESQVGVAEK